MWYTVANNSGHKVIVREISEKLALRKASAVFKRESKIKGLKVYKHKADYWTDLKVVDRK